MMQTDSEMDLVTVIMPTYNRASLIGQAIKSVLKQTYPHFELIVIDDGSADGTKEVVVPFLKDKRLRYLFQKNSGAAAARNRGLAFGKGRYVAFLDSDDLWEKEKLEIQLSVMKALPGVGMVCSDFSSVSGHGEGEKSHIKSYFSIFDDYELGYEDVFQNVLKEPIRGLRGHESVFWGNIYGTMLFGNLVLTSTCVCRQEVFDTIGMFDTKYETAEDYDLYLRVSRKFPIALIDKPMVCYRYTENQLSGDAFYGKMCVNVIDIFSKNIKNMDDQDFLKKNRRKIEKHLGMIQSYQAYFYFSHESMRPAADYYWRSIRNNPWVFRHYLYLLFSLLPVGLSRAVKKWRATKRYMGMVGSLQICSEFYDFLPK